MLIIVVRVYHFTQKMQEETETYGKVSLFFTTQNKMQNTVTTGFVIIFFIGGISIGGQALGPFGYAYDIRDDEM